jgi:ubiquinone/menaquinone biosynthesis C-methylase UbiE
MLERILEPEVMDSDTEAQEYDAMDFTEVNIDFAQLASTLQGETAKVLDIGTGTARIPLILSDFRPQWQITAIDLAPSMLKLAQTNLEKAQKTKQIKLELIDGKAMPYADRSFDLVISNSLVHHLPDPLTFFAEVKRVVKPQGSVLIRDLLRPESLRELEAIIQEANLGYSPHQEQLLRDSLQAALTVAEIQAIVNQISWKNVKVDRSSRRHWTLVTV